MCRELKSPKSYNRCRCLFSTGEGAPVRDPLFRDDEGRVTGSALCGNGLFSAGDDGCLRKLLLRLDSMPMDFLIWKSGDRAARAKSEKFPLA
jgi:hypothetical protein